MIKGVAFDFDCTLYDRPKVWDRLADGFLTRFAGRINPTLSKADVLEILRQGDAEGLAHDETWQGIFARYAKKGLFSQEVPFADFYAFIKAEFPPAIVLHDDATACIGTLRRAGIKTGIYTNGLFDYGRLKLHATGIDTLMDYILCSGDIGIGKPDPRGFAALARGMGLQPEEIAFVGDHPVNDVLGSRAAGMTAVWIRALVNWPDKIDPPEYTIQTLSEILALIDTANSAGP